MQYINDNDKDLICLRLPQSTVNKAARLVEKYGPHAARPPGSEGWWIYTNGLAYALGHKDLMTFKQRIEKAAKYLRVSPVILYNDPILTAKL